MAEEGTDGSGDGGSGGGGGGGGGGDIGAILAYLNHRGFGHDGDYTGNAGYGGDNTGPPGSAMPQEHAAQARAQALLETVMEPLPFPRASTARSLFDFTGADIDVYSGLPPEQTDPFTGMPGAEPFARTSPPSDLRRSAPVSLLRHSSLLSSPYLLAENDVVSCNSRRTSCLPEVKSDFNQSSMANLIQAEIDINHNASVLDLMEGRTKLVGNTEADIHKIASAAQAVSRSDEYQLASNVNQLRTHPLEVRHSAVLTGMGHMASGGFMMLGSSLIIYGSGGLALPLIGATGFAAGTGEAASGFALALSGADSVQTVEMSGKLDYVFALTRSPVSLMFGTTGLVLSNGDAGVSHRFAIAGGIAEDLATFRGDPSKLYSAVIPSLATKAEKGTAALLMKDVAALGYTARAGSIEQAVAKISREFTVEDLKAIDAFRTELAASGRLDLAGVAGHEAAGAAGAGGGVDFVRHGAFAQELKLHGPYTPLSGWLLDKASTQSLNYSIKYQLETRAFGEQLVQIRSVKHMWISPTDAVRLVGK